MPTLLLEHGARPGSAGILGETLREYGHRLRQVMVAGGESLPVDLDDVTAIVVTDGGQCLLSPPEWVAGEASLLRQAHERAIPVVGLGFGARLLAQALGGEIKSGGLCGWYPCQLTFPGREDPLYKGVAWDAVQFCCQAESIGKLPDGGVPLAQAGAAGAKPTVRAFCVGILSYGFEHRFELDRVGFDRLLGERSNDLATLGSSVDEARRGWGAFGAASERIGRRIAEGIALYLMPIDRVHAGRVKDLHY